MVWLAIGAGVLLLLLWLLRLFAGARVETIRRTGAWALGGLGAAAMLALLLSGRGAQAIWTILLFGPVIWRTVQAWRFRRAAGAPGGGGAPGEGETAVETATLAMRLDHATGLMSGRVRRGGFAGRELAELGLPELLALLADCRAADPESLPLLEAWLDRAAPDWREEEAAAASTGEGGGQRPGTAGGAGPMKRAEALAILGLAEGASAEEIRAAHRRLMRAAHPDHGGSDWLAARINQARDLLLG